MITRKTLICISMACFLFLTLVSVLLLCFLSHAHPVPPEIIKQSCNATRFPDQCGADLSKFDLPNPPKPMDIILKSVEISSEKQKSARLMVQSILDGAGGDPNRTMVGESCLEILGYSEYRLNHSSEILPRGKTKAARAWMSAALSYQNGCLSGLNKINTTTLVNETMAHLKSVTVTTSNSLGMLISYDLFGTDTTRWRPPMTERSGFWEDGVGDGPGSSAAESSGPFPTAMQADVTVCKVGPGCHRTVQEAVNAASDNAIVDDGGKRFVIYIREGVYEEIVRVPLEKTNVVFLGDGMGKTVITGNLSIGIVGVSTYETATVGVAGDGFMARDITFENTAGPDAQQAVAFRSSSDLSILQNCEFLGHQDTLYAHSLRQFYQSCRIEGTVDFIFGSSAAFFQNSTILVRPRQINPENGEDNTVTAHGRMDPAESTGFVFQNCSIDGTDEYLRLYHQKPEVHKNYLGRPWKEYARTVFLRSYLGAIIRPEGWMPWDGDFALSTLFYGEFENSGPGSHTSSRVKWSSPIPAEHVLAYSVQRFIQGNEWIASDSNVSQ